MAASVRAWLGLLALALGLGVSGARAADDLPEYRLKAAFLYNFALFTEWPADVGNTLRLCVLGADPFGSELDGLQGKAVGERSITLQRKAGIEGLKGCQIVFIAPAAAGQLPRALEALEGQTVLTVADSPGAARQGVALNMAVVQNKVSFEANLRAARAAKVNLSSKLLRLATEVIQ
jgi:hypothetical protein